MKRDWDLLRKQLTDIEEDRDVLADLPDEPKLDNFASWDEYEPKFKAYQTENRRILGHLELLIDNGYVEGIQILRGMDNTFSYGLHDPRLTMAGYDLLDTMRSQPVWEKIKSMAKTKGIELTFDVIKSFSVLAIKQIIG